MSVTLKLQWGKLRYDVPVDVSAKSAMQLKMDILKLTGVPIERQKLMAKGAWVATLKDDADLSALTIKDGQTVMLLGTAEVAPTSAAGGLKEAITFVEDMTAEEKALKVEKIPSGLQNLGNTCYLNATLQCLRKMPELQSALEGVQTNGYEFNSNGVLRLMTTQPFSPAGQAIRDRLPSIMSTCIGHTCRQLEATGAAVPPVSFVQLLKHFYPEPFAATTPQGNPMQQDAEEFFTLVTEFLKNSLPSSGDSSFEALLGVELEETLTCTETDAEPVVNKRERASKLVCNISGGTAGAKVDHIYDGLRLALDGTVEKHSAVLGRDAVWSKKSRVVRLPKYLCFQFMRFFWNRTPGSTDQGGKSKIMRAVTFPDVIDIYDLCSPDVQAKLRANRLADDKRIENEMAAKRAKISEELKAESGASDSAMAVETSSGAVAGGGAADMDVALEGLDAEEAAALKAAMAFSITGEVPETVFSSGAASSSSSSSSSSSGPSIFGEGLPDDFLGYYELHGIVTHKGRSADSGHYIGWVRKEPGSSEWFKYDDQTVTSCSTVDILRLNGGGDHDTAYLNFYRLRLTRRHG